MDNYYFGDAMPPIIPVELTSFTTISNNGAVELNWQTATEVNNHMFEIERKSEASEFRTIGYVEGHGTTTEPQSYSYIDNDVNTGTYVYRLKQVDFNGTFNYSNEVEVDVTAPLTFNLEQNYPNPFNPSTKINYSVPEAGNVKLAVYNIVGEEVAVLVNGYTQAGSFDVTFNASNLPSGVYLYKLQSANSVQTKKMILLK
jgi:Secretion system C-terminal sorting domain